MLVLTRKPNERILVGSDVVITLICLDGRQARIGVEAPNDVLILREELVGRPDRRGQERDGEGGRR